MSFQDTLAGSWLTLTHVNCLTWFQSDDPPTISYAFLQRKELQIEVAVCSIESGLPLKEAIPRHRASYLCVTPVFRFFVLNINTLSVDVVTVSLHDGLKNYI